MDVTYHAGKMHLLEYNDGSIVSQSSELADVYKDNQECAKAANACADFVTAIADVCVNNIKRKLAVSASVATPLNLSTTARQTIRAKL